MRGKRVGWVSAVCFLAASGLVFAQAKPGSVGGTVFRKDGTTAPKAAMVVKHSATGVTLRDIADKKGRFRIKDAPPGDYQVEATFQGVLYKYPAVIKVKPGRLTLICIQMDRRDGMNILKLKEVKCEPKAIIWWPKYGIIAGAAVVAGVTIAIVAHKKEASPVRP